MVLLAGLSCFTVSCAVAKNPASSSPAKSSSNEAALTGTSISLAYQSKVALINHKLGISSAHLAGLTLEPEATQQKSVGNNQTMNSDAAASFLEMRKQAEADKVRLVPISGYRSPEAQAQIIKRKLNAGQSLDAILTVNRPPGYSQHGAGIALDVSAGEANPLSVDFAKSETYRWLVKNAHLFGFVFTYPPGNSSGITFEPWHLQYVGADAPAADEELMLRGF
jgi:zinc D-Ala-D-Ala carboxypeptidase